jgi:rhamnose transport system permease protein
LLLKHESILLVVVVIEIVVFGIFGTNFGTADNIANIVRHSVEIGLLALVMLPIILMGGIDLSVGSLLGLCAVLFGKMWRDAGCPWQLAAFGAVGIGAIAGAFNGFLITSLRLPPLIVTLGTYSLFRGLAEAITRGADAFTKFPEAFLFLGVGRIAGIPTQAWIFGAVAVATWLAVHRTVWGRCFRAIGFSPEGARYAGIPVDLRMRGAYVAAGAIAALASITYTARFGAAKADAGTGYELAAITAVVLGGASIFGGIGSAHGTLLGVAAIAILTNGLSRVPATMSNASELSGMFTGALLLLALALGDIPRWATVMKKRPPNETKPGT